jgi:tetratricopeptide (TPR) repeat protein
MLMKMLASLLCACVLLAPSLWSDEGHHHSLTEDEIGSVHFSTSCSGEVVVSFNRAVALLHSFQYEQAREAFGAIAARDPKCALAYWGIAMSHYHGLWGNGNVVAGREALAKAQEIASSNAKTSAHDRAYIDALAEIYREDAKDRTAHAQAFEHKMGEVQAGYPSDTEAAIFHALTLAITAPKTDKTFANQRKCGEILEPIFSKQPHHPGVAHYIIHCYDNPVLAEKGLGAARMYAKIAPASAHANHMPSHIFTRVGAWDESIASNLKSAELAAQAERTSLNGEARDQRLHAMDYLEYAYLQSGRVKQAEAVGNEMTSLSPLTGLTLTGDYATAAIPARHSLELGNWQKAAALKVAPNEVPWAQAITWMAIGVGSARSGDLERALEAQTMLGALRDKSAAMDNYWSNQIEVQRREVEAWIAEKHGKHPEAVQMMRAAAELEDSMDKHAVTPGPVIPAREMLASLLIDKQPQEAFAEYEAVLKIAPNRFNALYGAATAADAAGNKAVANRYFHKLTEIGVGDERPELVNARKKVAVTASN